MKQQNKYPDTNTFHFYNANPKNRISGDCVIRAVCTALRIPWEQCVREMTECGIKHGYVLNDRKTIEIYLKEKGARRIPMPRHADGSRFTAEEFCQNLANTNKRYVLSLAHHMVAVVDSRAWDIWDSTVKYVGKVWEIE